MPTKVKGLLKGLKCISHIFENKKEEELQIGFPTDVKHVAHIGGQGPSTNAPSWMNEFDSTQQLTLQPVDPLGETASASEDMKQTGAGAGAGSPDLPLRNVKDAQDSPRRLLSTGFGSPLSSPSKHGSSASKHLRRHRKSAAASDAPPQESSRSTRHSRRNQNLGLGVEAPSHDAAMVSKQSRRRKSKGSSGGGSTRLRSKGQSPSNDASSLTEHGSGSEHGQGLKKIQSHLSTVTEVTEEGKG